MTAEGVEHVWSEEQATPMVEAYCAGYAALIAAGYPEAIAAQGCGDDFENAELLIKRWNLVGGIEEWKIRAVVLMSAAGNKRAVQLVAEHLAKCQTLDGDYVSVLVDLADGECTEEEFRQYLSGRTGAGLTPPP